LSYIRQATRLQRLPAQFFARLVAATAALGAAGHDVINLGQGNPDLPTPEHIVEVASRAGKNPAMHKYTPFGGLRSPKEAAPGWVKTK